MIVTSRIRGDTPDVSVFSYFRRRRFGVRANTTNCAIFAIICFDIVILIRVFLRAHARAIPITRRYRVRGADQYSRFPYRFGSVAVAFASHRREPFCSPNRVSRGPCAPRRTLARSLHWPVATFRLDCARPAEAVGRPTAVSSSSPVAVGRDRPVTFREHKSKTQNELQEPQPSFAVRTHG